MRNNMTINFCDKQERFRLARKIAEEGIVLLKNENGMLPLGKEPVAVFGRTQIDTIRCGTGSAFCESEYTSDILSGMEREGIAIDKSLADQYRNFSKENPIASFGVWGSGSHLQPEMPISEEDICAASRRAEKAIMVIGRTAGENDDVSPIAGDYLLSSEEEYLIDRICQYFDHVCILVNSGNMIDLSFSDRAQIDAVLLLNLPGMEGGNAVAGVLSGRVNPSGKLTDTIAYSYQDYPTFRTFGKRGGLIQTYTEDIYVGYRYFETHRPDRVRYPFGFGLSYTEFCMTCVSYDVKDGTVCVDIDVANIGTTYAGKEVVMLYTSSPGKMIGAPSLELRAFAKTHLLVPGESERITLSFSVEDMASFDDEGIIEKDAWIMEKGLFSIYFGNNVKTLSLAGTYENPTTVVLKKCVHLQTRLSARLDSDGTEHSITHLPPDLSAGIPLSPFELCEIPASSALPEQEDLSFLLRASAAGPYRLRVLSEKGGRFSDHYVLLLDGVAATNFDCALDGSTNGEIILAPGTLTLTIKNISSSFHPISGISLEKNNDPIEIGDGVSYVEGGKYTECALYVVTRPFSDDGPIKSGRALARMHTPGRYALYHLNVKKAGYYDVCLRYENPHEEMMLDETFAFLISNVGQAVPAIPLSHTSDETNRAFATSAPMRLALPEGDCWFKIVSVTTTSPSVAYFTFSPGTETEINVVSRKNKHEVEEKNSKTAYVRRSLDARGLLPDFRDVIAGSMSMEAFAQSLSDEELVNLTCGNTEGQIGYLPSRGVPEAYWADGPIGLRLATPTTAYPSGTMVASSWNVSLARELGRAIGMESHRYHIDVWLAPGVNLHRDPCCGRNFEYDSEDPLLSGKIAAAIISGVQEKNVAATIKHFAANNTEYQRMRSDSYISARALRELYMKAFEIAIREARPWALMTSYNLINGEKVPQDRTICEDVLRNEFGFDGVLVTDWGNDSHHEKELLAGHDLKMSFGDPKAVLACMKEGVLSRERVRLSAMRVLDLILKTACAHDREETDVGYSNK